MFKTKLKKGLVPPKVEDKAVLRKKIVDQQDILSLNKFKQNSMVIFYSNSKKPEALSALNTFKVQQPHHEAQINILVPDSSNLFMPSSEESQIPSFLPTTESCRSCTQTPY